MHKIRSWAALAIAAAVMVIGSIVATVAPAQAAGPWIQVCNAASSDDAIRAYNPNGFSRMIYPGGCYAVDDAGGNARVDVDPSGGSADIDSWKKLDISISGNWAAATCFVNEDGASNPYSGDATTSYWTSRYSNCT